MAHRLNRCLTVSACGMQGLGLHDHALRYLHASGVLAHDEAPCVARAEKLLAKAQSAVCLLDPIVHAGIRSVWL